MAFGARKVISIPISARTYSQNGLELVSIQSVERQFELVLFRRLDPSSQTSQIVRALVEVSVVQIVLVGEDALRHCDYQIDGEDVFVSSRSLERVTAGRIDARRSFILQLIQVLSAYVSSTQFFCNEPVVDRGWVSAQ